MIKKIFPFLIIIIFITTLVQAGSDRMKVPRVRYIEPKNDSVIDLKNKETLVFRWKKNPLPAGGRMAYKFEIFKEFTYERVVNETLERDVYSIEIPSDKFEGDTTYSWQVKQRDASSRFWSLEDRWSFKVRK